MSEASTTPPGPTRENRRGAPIILILAVVSALIYAGLALAGDLTQHLPFYLVSHTVLAGIMLAAWRWLPPGGQGLRLVVGAALVFRIVAAFGPPALSDDVYRYVWDGRVQLHGVHPYRYAPADPELAGLRDADWARINHPELKTIYPPLAQACFVALAGMGAGPTGFKLTMGLLDFAVVLALGGLLRRLSLPHNRLVLYAWNPLAVIESSGSGHLEPLGVLLMLLAGRWIIDRRGTLSTLALAASVHVKLLPAVLLPGHLRRRGAAVLLLLLPALAIPFLPYAFGGPLVGGGLFDYAQNWERNATGFAAAHALFDKLDTGPTLTRVVTWLQQRFDARPFVWDFLYDHVWPRDVARLAVLLVAAAWVLYLARRRGLDAPRESLLALGGVLLLSPTLHPWYLLWVLPLAALYCSPGWLLLGVTVALANCNPAGDVPWLLRACEYVPPLVLAFVMRKRGLVAWRA